MERTRNRTSVVLLLFSKDVMRTIFARRVGAMLALFFFLAGVGTTARAASAGATLSGSVTPATIAP